MSPAVRSPVRRSDLRYAALYFLAIMGDAAFFVILTGFTTRSHGPEVASFVLALGGIPRAVFMIPGGILSDRFSPKLVACVSAVLRTGAVAILLIAVCFSSGSSSPMFAAAVVFGLVDALFIPAMGALPPWLVQRDELPKVQAWRITALRLGNIAGPSLGAILLTQSAGLAYALLGLAFLILILALISLPVVGPPSNPTRVPRGGIKGLRPLIPLLFSIGLAEIPFSGPFGAAVVMLGEESSRRASPGWLLSAFSLGGLFAGLALVRWAKLGGLATWVTAQVAVGALLSCFPYVTQFWPSLITCAILGLASGGSLIVGYSILQLACPATSLGKATAFLSFVSLGVSPVLLLVTGWVSSTYGLTPFFFISSGFLLLATMAAFIHIKMGLGGANSREPRTPVSVVD